MSAQSVSDVSVATRQNMLPSKIVCWGGLALWARRFGPSFLGARCAEGAAMADVVGDADCRMRRDSIDIDSSKNADASRRGDGLNGYRRPSLDSGGPGATGAALTLAVTFAFSYPDSADTSPYRHLPVPRRLGDRRS